MLKSLVAVAAALVGSADAFWRMECPSRSGLARIDPIVDPGQVSQHVHAIHGSGSFSPSATTDSLLAGNCTSCRVTQDQSGYWHPALYFQDGNTGEFELVEQVGGMLAYYLLYGDNIQAFPTGFRMISGNTFRRNYTAGDPSQPDPPKSFWAELNQTSQDILAQRALGFNCLNYAKTPEGTLYRHYLPDKEYLDANCADGVRFELMFPSCWKGGDAIDSANHKSHMAFPDLVMTGDCPDDYPVRVPSMLFEVIWNTAAFASRTGTFVIANGDETGYGYHGDFMMGWDEGFLQQAVDTCTNLSGLIEDCPIFDVVDQATAAECQFPMSQPWASENVLGPVASLPGNVEITWANDTEEGAPAPSSTKKPSLTYSPGESPTNSASFMPGQIFKESKAAGTTAADSTAPASSPNVAYVQATVSSKTSQAEPTTTPAPEAAAISTSASYFSTQLITSGSIVSEIFWEEEVVYVTNFVDETTTVTSSTPPTPSAAKRRRHIHDHVRRHI